MKMDPLKVLNKHTDTVTTTTSSFQPVKDMLKSVQFLFDFLLFFCLYAHCGAFKKKVFTYTSLVHHFYLYFYCSLNQWILKCRNQGPDGVTYTI